MTRISKRTAVDFSALNYLSESAYNSSKWNLGKGLIANNGGTAIDKYIAPDFQAIRPMEESTPFAVTQIYTHNHSSSVAYIFGVENLAKETAKATELANQVAIEGKKKTEKLTHTLETKILEDEIKDETKKLKEAHEKKVDQEVKALEVDAQIQDEVQKLAQDAQIQDEIKSLESNF